MIHVLWVAEWRPSSVNELLHCHWGKASRKKKLDRDFVAVSAKNQKTPAAIGKRRVTVRVTLPKRQRRFDGDALFKSLLDALVAAGLLVNDDPVWLELMPLEQVRAKPGETWGTRIFIEDVADDA